MPADHPPTRDLRLDLFRGLALLCIVIDHTPGNRLSEYTYRNLGFSDASELFVFISAYTAGMVYTGRAAAHGMAAMARRAWARAGRIYGAHLLLLVVATLVAAGIVRVTGDPQVVQGMNVGPLLTRPAEVVVDALTLVFQPTFMNILPLYVVLMAGLPLMLWLMYRSPWAAVGVSFLVWAAARPWPATPLDNPYGRTWEFNPVAWQFLFVIGAGLGAATRGKGFWVPRSGLLAGVALAYAVAAFAIGTDAWSYDGSTVGLPDGVKLLVFPLMDRANLSLWRLAHLLAVAYLAAHVIARDSRVPLWLPVRPLVLIGQHSLMMFSLGVLLSMAGWAAFAGLGQGAAVQAGVNAANVVVMAACAWGLSRLFTSTGTGSGDARPGTSSDRGSVSDGGWS